MSKNKDVKPAIEVLPLYLVIDGIANVYPEEQKPLDEVEALNTDEETVEIDSQFLREYEEDFGELTDDTDMVYQERIKRYKKIVDRLKKKYDGKCQICNETFPKEDGSNYSEAHHLEYLSQGGSQAEQNVVILCATHHRMFHYGKNVKIGRRQGNSRIVMINEVRYELKYKEDIYIKVRDIQQHHIKSGTEGSY